MRFVKVVAGVVGGVVLAMFLTASVGILSLQAMGREVGGVFDLNNELVSIRPPSIPVLEYAGMALCGAAVFFVVGVWARRIGRGIRWGLWVGFVAASITVVVWSLIVDFETGPAGAEPSSFALEGWPGWLEYGGTNPAVHLLITIVLVCAAVDLVDGRRWRAAPSVGRNTGAASDAP
ncbi:hypothetical protein M4I32_08545 [Microbacterium sp. LRZ72]|uniref:hypothetical protein n=1 Tax=Microbacterium sp. LRZ72 TaxID=2942481 RepID=UPI0029ABB206|nr:hypothetical protein [Microbacterium sp. LRZ72]MDX2376845.1 hypothetical protein [Microbacterium sp. LRZ72]